jgi:flagellar assembly protein FliH
LSENAISSYAFEQLEPSAHLLLDTPARVLAQATVEADRIRDQARVEGYAEGHARGLSDATAETASAAHALRDAVQGLESQRQETADAVERDAIELALALSAKILSGALEVQPERVVDVVRGALRRITDRRRITVLVDPGDLDVVTSAIGELQTQAGGIDLCEVQSDRRVGRGGAVVRTAEGEVDVSVETQLERAREVVLAELDGGEHAR